MSDASVDITGLANVLQHGARGTFLLDGWDDTAAIQACLAASPNGIYIPDTPYGYLVNDLYLLYGPQKILGAGGLPSGQSSRTMLFHSPGHSGIRIDMLIGHHGSGPSGSAYGARVQNVGVYPSGPALTTKTIVDIVGGKTSEWAASTIVPPGTVVLPPTRDGHYLRTTLGGTTAASPPDDFTAATITDGSVTWTRHHVGEGVTPFAAVEALTVGQFRRPSMTGVNLALDGQGFGAIYRVITAGTTGSSEPTWGPGDGSVASSMTDVVASGTVVFRRVSALFVAPVAAIADFARPQIVRVEGVGPTGTLSSQDAIAATTSGSPLIHIPGIGGGQTGVSIRAGEYVVCPPAGLVYPTLVLSVDLAAHTVTVATNCTHTLTTASIQLCTPSVKEIAEIINGNTIVFAEIQFYGPSIGNTVMQHCDCDIVQKTLSQLDNVSCSAWQGANGAGCGIYLHGDHNDYHYSNVNDASISNANIVGPWLGIYVSGDDANSIILSNISLVCSDYGITESGFLGNTYNGMKASGGRCFRVTGEVNASLFDGCYAEGGSVCAFGGSRATIVGGTMPQDAGGFSDVGGYINYRTFGRRGLTPYEFELNPAQSPYAVNAYGGANTIRWLSLAISRGDPVDGWHSPFTIDALAVGSSPILISDSAASSGAGKFWAPNGISLGCAANGAQTEASRRTIYMLDGAPPYTGTFKVGDRVARRDATIGAPDGYTCTTAGVDSAAVWRPWANL